MVQSQYGGGRIMRLAGLGIWAGGVHEDAKAYKRRRWTYCSQSRGFWSWPSVDLKSARSRDKKAKNVCKEHTWVQRLGLMTFGRWAFSLRTKRMRECEESKAYLLDAKLLSWNANLQMSGVSTQCARSGDSLNMGVREIAVAACPNRQYYAGMKGWIVDCC